MSASENKKKYTFDRAGNYQIQVRGYLDDSWGDRLGGMRITANGKEDQVPVTALVGGMRDQAELVGVLNTLYELHLTLLSVERLNGD